MGIVLQELVQHVSRVARQMGEVCLWLMAGGVSESLFVASDGPLPCRQVPRWKCLCSNLRPHNSVSNWTLVESQWPRASQSKTSS